jgi:hypothetical protein
MAAGPDLERLYDAHAQALIDYVLNLTQDESETRAVGRRTADERHGDWVWRSSPK